MTQARSEPRLQRVTGVVLLTIATALVLVLAPGVRGAQAADLLDQLRAPGQAAFVAAHRGDRASAPENTVPAFQSAVASGSDVIEVDIQLTADRYPVIMHDDTVDRTTDGTGAVADLTLAQIRELDAGAWFSAEFAGVPVPQLDDFLDILVSTPQVTGLLELKGAWTVDDTQILLDRVDIRGVRDRVVVASFSPRTVRALQHSAPDIPRVLIRRALPIDPVDVAQRFGAVALMTRPSELDRRPDVVEQMHDAGLGVLLYTLNTESRWGDALAYGVDGIVTDQPSALDSWIAATAPGT